MAPLHPDSPLGRLAHHLSALTDPRSARRPVHLLDEILLMALGTFCTGGRTFVDRAHFAHGHQERLRTFMELPGGLPSHDTFGHVFAALDARELDAAHAQSATATQVIRQGGDYVLCVKGNQPGTQRAVQEHLAASIAAAREGHSRTTDKEHGRLEERRCWVRTDLGSFGPRSQWSGLGAVAVVETRSENLRTGVVSTERRGLITSLRPRAGESPAAFAAVLAGVVRAHWQIENSLHWRLDVLLGEDACRARSGEAAANLAVLRKITLNTLKL